MLDPHALPLGDGKVSAGPKRGYVFSCMTEFRGGGAQHGGGWIHAPTWDETRKISVQGDVAWPEARFAIAVTDNGRQITGNGLPLAHTTGIFPVRPSDPAHRIDRNPNRIETQPITLSLPLSPAAAPVPTCVPMGMIGVAVDGVAIFNALDDAGRDAVAHEVQDHCNGHPQMRGEYHYHGPSPCLKGDKKNNVLIGYALDGFGIYSRYDESGKELTNADLDECHGRVSRINWDGKSVLMYHYVLTREYPYTVGCFRGTPARARTDVRAAPRRGRRGNGSQRPPAEAIAACAGQSRDTRCRFTSLRGDTITGSCRSPGDALACVPDRR